MYLKADERELPPPPIAQFLVVHVSVETAILSTVCIETLIGGYRAPSVPGSFVNFYLGKNRIFLACHVSLGDSFQFFRIGLKTTLTLEIIF